MKHDTMKLYVWGEMLEGAFFGHVLAIAGSEEEGRGLAKEAVLAAYAARPRFSGLDPALLSDMAGLNGPPTAVYSDPKALAFLGSS